MSPNPKIYTRTPASHIPVLSPVVPPRTSTPVLPPLVPAQTPRPILPPSRLIPPAMPTYDHLPPMSHHQRITTTHGGRSQDAFHSQQPERDGFGRGISLFFHSPCLRTNNYFIRTLLSPSRARHLFSRSRREPGLSRHRGSPFAGSKHACG